MTDHTDEHDFSSLCETCYEFGDDCGFCRRCDIRQEDAGDHECK